MLAAIPVDGSDKRIIRKSEKAFDFTTVYIARGEGHGGETATRKMEEKSG